MRGTREAKRLFPLASPNVPRSTKPILRGVDWWQQENYFFFPVKSLHKGEPDSEYDDEMKDERCVRRQTIAREKGASFSYAYDFGNGWRQQVTVACPFPNLLRFWPVYATLKPFHLELHSATQARSHQMGDILTALLASG